MNAPDNISAPFEVPVFVQERCDHWGKLVAIYGGIYYILGIGSAVAAAGAAAIGGYAPAVGQCLAALAAILTTAFGFIQPRQNYQKFRKGWRALDSEIMRFKEGMGTREDLINTVTRMEAFFDRYEDETEKIGPRHAESGNSTRSGVEA
ncbi:hypothetical protein LJR029_002329 [Caballeronia sp. LjRoot29]|uniref:hypothetical protein n=1 Tax=Caballeronia sp. LjRoot29 TaxID=3342315 RepID=UPI003ECEE7C2